MSAATPAKASKPRAPRKPAAHPTYASMVKEAIATLKDRTGSSLPAITKVCNAASGGRGALASGAHLARWC